MPLDNILASLLHLRSSDAHEDALRIMLELGVQAVDADEGSLLLLDEPTLELEFVMTVGDMLSESTLKGQRVPLGQGLTGIAAQTGETQLGSPTHAAVKQPLHRAERSPHRLVAAPMCYRKRVVGVLTAARYQPKREFSVDQIRMFERVATLAGIVVAERQRAQHLGEAGSGAQAAGDREELARQVAETVLRIGRGDEARLRSTLHLLKQVERLGGS